MDFFECNKSKGKSSFSVVSLFVCLFVPLLCCNSKQFKLKFEICVPGIVGKSAIWWLHFNEFAALGLAYDILWESKEFKKVNQTKNWGRYEFSVWILLFLIIISNTLKTSKTSKIQIFQPFNNGFFQIQLNVSSTSYNYFL